MNTLLVNAPFFAIAGLVCVALYIIMTQRNLILATPPPAAETGP